MGYLSGFGYFRGLGRGSACGSCCAAPPFGSSGSAAGVPGTLPFLSAEEGVGFGSASIVCRALWRATA